MAKEPQQQIKEINISALVPRADTSRANPTIYANHVQFTIGGNELIIDFYQIISNRDTNKSNPEVSLLQRVMLPAAIAKGFTSGLVNLILQTEELLQTELPDQRKSQAPDKVDLWQLLNQHTQMTNTSEQ